MKKAKFGYLAVSLILSCALLAGCDGRGETSTTPTGSSSDTTTTTTTTEAETTTTEPEQETTTEPEQETTTEPETPTTTEPETPPTEPDGEDEPSEPGEPVTGVAAAAQAQLGKPYRYGAAGPDAFDNSGLLYYCYREAGITVPRRTGDLYNQGTAVEKDALQPGDAVFFWSENEGNPEFAAIYIGDGICIAARQEDKPVSELNMTYPYFEEHYVGARRYSAD